jgi:hypothetical protein
MNRTLAVISTFLGITLGMAGASKALAQAGFVGGFELQNWSTSGIQGGTTRIDPPSCSSATAEFSYDVNLGNPAGGVSFRAVTFSNIAPASGNVTFDWDYSGFHAFFNAEIYFEVFAETSAGRQTLVVIPAGTPGGGGFNQTGTVTNWPIEEGMEWGIVIGGSNFDTNSVLRGTLAISNFDAPFSPPITLFGGYELQNWDTTGIQGGTTQIIPASGQSATAELSYDVNLGNPGVGVSFRTATFSHIAQASGNVTFDWDYTGFHAFFNAEIYFEVFAETSAGRQTLVVIPAGTPGGGGFNQTGTVSNWPIEEGMEWGIIIGGRNGDSNSVLRGTLTISNFDAPPAQTGFVGAYESRNWSAAGILEGTTQIAPLCGSSTTADFSYGVNLGNPGGGVSFRTATFSNVAPASGNVTFDWEYTGFHAFFAAEIYFEVFAETSTGRQTQLVIPAGTPGGGGFTQTGTVANWPIEEGMEWGVVIGGSNFDTNSVLRGTLTISNLDAPAACPCACAFDTSTGVGVCDIFDFLAFQNSFVGGDPCACDIDTSTGAGICDIFDFLAFQNEFVGGCP